MAHRYLDIVTLSTVLNESPPRRATFDPIPFLVFDVLKNLLAVAIIISISAFDWTTSGLSFRSGSITFGSVLSDGLKTGFRRSRGTRSR